MTIIRIFELPTQQKNWPFALGEDRNQLRPHSLDVARLGEIRGPIARMKAAHA
jgi:hypothetical protein